MKLFRMLLAVVAVASLAGLVLAHEEAKTVTISGRVVCAKCSLHEEGRKECQNVVQTTQNGKTTMYYIEKNDVSEKFGHVCQGEKAVTVTGTVKDKDGKQWIVPTKMEEVAS